MSHVQFTLTFTDLRIADELSPAAQTDVANFSWAINAEKTLQHVYSTSWNAFGNHASTIAGYMPSVASDGLSLLGLLWNVDRFIDLRHLQRKYSDSWLSLRRKLEKTPPSTVRAATTHLLFEILQALRAQSEIEVADSIINSTLNHGWRTNGSTFEQGIESVRDFPPGLSVENRKGMFLLDSSADGSFHQCWVIDRVMKRGGLWVGRVVKKTTASGATDSANDQIEIPLESQPEQRSHQSKLLTRWFLSNMISHQAALDPKKPDEQVNIPKDPERQGKKFDAFKATAAQGDIMAALATQLHQLDSRAELSRNMDERRSVFDIDGDESGDCLIFQPYHMMLESIPRPELRSLSISWKVERVANAPPDTFTTYGKVKGMWRYLYVLHEGIRANLV